MKNHCDIKVCVHPQLNRVALPYKDILSLTYSEAKVASVQDVLCEKQIKLVQYFAYRSPLRPLCLGYWDCFCDEKTSSVYNKCWTM